MNIRNIVKETGIIMGFTPTDEQIEKIIDILNGIIKKEDKAELMMKGIYERRCEKHPLSSIKIILSKNSFMTPNKWICSVCGEELKILPKKKERIKHIQNVIENNKGDDISLDEIIKLIKEGKLDYNTLPRGKKAHITMRKKKGTY